MTRTLTATLIALLALVGCSSSGSRETSASNEAPFEVNRVPIQTTEVTAVKSYKFEPQAISIAAGTTVTWINDDDFPHNVHLFGDNEETYDLPIGESVDVTFDQPGDYLYECSIHPQQMRGKVIVTG